LGTLLFQAGCIGTAAKYAVLERPTSLAPKPDQALVYVYRTGSRAPGSVVEVYWKGKIVGVLPSSTYFHFTPDAGSQLISAHLGANQGAINLDLKKGEVYYLKQDFTFVGIVTLEAVPADEGRAALRELKYVEVLPAGG
jgi:hypothetical protein